MTVFFEFGIGSSHVSIYFKAICIFDVGLREILTVIVGVIGAMRMVISRWRGIRRAGARAARVDRGGSSASCPKDFLVRASNSILFCR